MSDLPPSTKPEPTLGAWVGEASTVFINGVISGFGGGTLSGGASTGIVAYQGERNHVVLLICAGLGFIGAALGNGFKRFFVWHDANPFPNIWKARSANPDGTPDSGPAVNA